MRSPVFRHAGSWRNAGTTKQHPQKPPRRRWQAVITPHDPTSHPRDTQHVARNAMVAATASHHLRGAIWVGYQHALPACRHDPAWRNTGLRTAATPRGVANYLAFCYRPPRTAPATKVGEIRGRGNVRLLSSTPTSTVCACRSTRSRVLTASPPLRALTCAAPQRPSLTCAAAQRYGHKKSVPSSRVAHFCGKLNYFTNTFTTVLSAFTM